MKRRKQIFFLLSWNDYRIFQGISCYAREVGWRMEARHFFTNQFPQDLFFNGMIAMGHRDAAVNAFVCKKARSVPTVILGTDSLGIETPRVVPDNRQIARLAADHLYDLYHKRFGWFACDVSPSGTERMEAFRERVTEFGTACLDLSCGNAPYAAETALAHLKACPKPIGVMCRDDHDAVVLLDLCHEARLRTPEDVAVVGVGDLEALCAFAPIPITSVSPDMEALGYQAASVLDQHMRGRDVPATTVVPPGGLVRRHSTGCLAITDPHLKKVIHRIDTRFRETFNVEELASFAGVSRRKLYTLFENEMRCSPHHYLLTVRLEQAKKRVAENELTLNEIADICGFNTSRTLNRVFHQRFGFAPSKWRRKEKS
jgi:LacI family transcriptional regulator